MSRLVRGAGVAIALMMGAGVAFAQTPSLEVLEAQALSRHPAIQHALARVEEARGRAAQAGAWDNPIVGGTVGDLRARETPRSTFGGFVEQAIVLGGKREAARVSAGAEVTVREAELAAVRQRVRVDVRTAYYEMLAAAEKLGVSERLLAIVDESVGIVRQLANVGIAERPDILEAEAEAARQKALVASARAHQAGAWQRLGAAVADPALVMPAGAQILSGTVPVLDRQASLDQILQHNPDVRAADAVVARERTIVEVERRRMSPDLTLRGDAAQNRERVGWEFGAEAGVTLPLWNRNRAGLLAVRSAVTAAEAAAAQVRLELGARFSALFEDYERARLMRAAFQTEILPRLEEAFALHLRTYRSMATPYPRVLLAQRRLVQATEEYVDALDRAWQAAVRIQGLAGTQ